MIVNWKSKNPPEPPYFAVVFISIKKDNDTYEEVDNFLMEKVQDFDGYLGYSVVSKDSQGIFISFWRDEASILRWKNFDKHKAAKRRAPQEWYEYYYSMICEVKSSLTFEALTHTQKP